MRYRVLDSFKAQTTKGEMELKAGQVITLPKDKAISLIEAGKIIPVERVAYRIYSEILHAYLWVVDTDEDMHFLRGRGVSEAIYTADEIRKLKGMDKENLKAIHRVKEVFEDSKIEQVMPKKGEKPC